MKRRAFSCRLSVVIINLFCILLVITCAFTCRSSKKTVTIEPKTLTSCYPLESIYSPACKFDVVYAGNSYSFNGSIYIQSDSICYFRCRLLIEVLHGAIYRDSFVVVNYLERTCYEGKNDYLRQITGFPVSPKSLLMLLTADHCEETYRNSFNFEKTISDNDRILLQGDNRSLLEVNVNNENNTVENISLYNSRQRQALLSASYSGYNNYEQFNLPGSFDITVNDKNTSIKIKAAFQQLLLNQQQDVHLNVPSRYKVIVLE